MKTTLILLTSAAMVCSSLAGSFGPGPWADGAYYPGNLNGKYMGVVTGNNISGVLGFAIVDGAPPFRVAQEQSGSDTGVLINDTIELDVLQNYFAIFVEGRTYSGVTTAGIDISSKTVAGALQGRNPPGMPATVTGAPGPGDFAFDASDALSIVNRGLSGGFTAKIKSDQAVFTFKGDGQLSTPANEQSYRISAVPTATAGVVTNEVVSGQYTTDSTCFNVSGIRTSFLSSNPAARQDEQTFSAGAGAGGGN
jgi:hypothetical protein